MIGFGSIGRGTLPLIERHFIFDPRDVHVIEPSTEHAVFLEQRGIDHVRAALTPEALSAIVDTVPEEWLETTDWLPDTDAVRAAYLDHLAARLANPTAWLS